MEKKRKVFVFLILMVLIFFTISKIVSGKVIINKNGEPEDKTYPGNHLVELPYVPSYYLDEFKVENEEECKDVKGIYSKVEGREFCILPCCPRPPVSQAIEYFSEATFAESAFYSIPDGALYCKSGYVCDENSQVNSKRIDKKGEERKIICNFGDWEEINKNPAKYLRGPFRKCIKACSDNNPCPNGYKCINGRCEKAETKPECKVDGDCGIKDCKLQKCVNGKCVDDRREINKVLQDIKQNLMKNRKSILDSSIYFKIVEQNQRRKLQPIYGKTMVSMYGPNELRYIMGFERRKTGLFAGGVGGAAVGIVSPFATIGSIYSIEGGYTLLETTQLVKYKLIEKIMMSSPIGTWKIISWLNEVSTKTKEVKKVMTRTASEVQSSKCVDAIKVRISRGDWIELQTKYVPAKSLEGGYSVTRLWGPSKYQGLSGNQLMKLFKSGHIVKTHEFGYYTTLPKQGVGGRVPHRHFHLEYFKNIKD